MSTSEVECLRCSNNMWDFPLATQSLLDGEELRYGGPDQPERKIPLGNSGALQDVLYYEFVAEIDDTNFKSASIIPPGVTSWTVPAELIVLGEGEVKFEVIVRVETSEATDDDGETVESRPSNQSAVEDCFEIIQAYNSNTSSPARERTLFR